MKIGIYRAVALARERPTFSPGRSYCGLRPLPCKGATISQYLQNDKLKFVLHEHVKNHAAGMAAWFCSFRSVFQFVQRNFIGFLHVGLWRNGDFFPGQRLADVRQEVGILCQHRANQLGAIEIFVSNTVSG